MPGTARRLRPSARSGVFFGTVVVVVADPMSIDGTVVVAEPDSVDGTRIGDESVVAAGAVAADWVAPPASGVVADLGLVGKPPVDDELAVVSWVVPVVVLVVVLAVGLVAVVVVVVVGIGARSRIVPAASTAWDLIDGGSGA